MQVDVAGKEGGLLRVEMATYGIGVSRLVGAIIEAFHDEAGIIWPEAVAPFRVAILNLRLDNDGCNAAAESLYAALQARNISGLYDDTDNWHAMAGHHRPQRG